MMLKSGWCRHNGNQGTMDRPAKAHNTLQEISLRTRLSKPGEPPHACRGLDRDFYPERNLSSRGHHTRGLGEAFSLARIPSSPRALCLRGRAHMGSAPPAESRTRQSVMTPALSLPCPCIKQSTKQCQAKEVQDLPLW